MKTLWINILGFASGRTGLVINDGQAPYKEGMVPDGVSAVVSRFDRAGCATIVKHAEEVEEIRVLGYGPNAPSNVVAREDVIVALDPWHLADDGLTELMPKGN